jgi:drug/metabolite transporter (DMT)-like permease
MLAALLYLGAGIGVSAVRVSSFIGQLGSAEARLRRSDVRLLCAIIVFGGIIGPVLMLIGLNRISALAGSLLLNLEAIFTILIAVLVFGEHLSWRGALASMFVISGAVLMSYQAGPASGDVRGVFAMVGACLCWAVDNNFSQRLSIRDPVAVVQIKTLGAGTSTLALALLTGHSLPGVTFLISALIVGILSYGVSLICVMQALRYLGAARETAWFSTAPFVGALLSIAIFRTVPGTVDGIAAVSMIAGVGLLVRERHGHLHTHEALEHDHLHSHDAHHQHAHEGQVQEPHSHQHRHDSITHDHPHASDVHHRHPHAKDTESRR